MYFCGSLEEITKAHLKVKLIKEKLTNKESSVPATSRLQI